LEAIAAAYRLDGLYDPLEGLGVYQ
jgi:hypothetical protein